MGRCRISTIALLFIYLTYLSSGFLSTPAALMQNHNNIHSIQSSLSSFPTKRTSEKCISRSIVITTTTTRMTSDDKEGENIEQIDTSSSNSNSETLADDATSDDVPTTTTNNALDNISINGNTPNTNKRVENKDNSNGFSLILIPTLLFKFTIVLLVKFATDIVVFPSLWLYRLARLLKRKFIRGLRKMFGGSGSGKNGSMEEVVNGDSTSPSV